MHLILDGQVELCVGEPPSLIAILSAGQCLGETSLLYSADRTPVRSATAMARTRVETANFAADEFVKLVRRRPDIGQVIYRNLAADVSAKLKLTDQQLH